jgi:hypothetical protein
MVVIICGIVGIIVNIVFSIIERNYKILFLSPLFAVIGIPICVFLLMALAEPLCEWLEI